MAEEVKNDETAALFAKFGVVTETKPAHARCLVLGASKVGKTTAIASTAPKPLVLNGDGEAALLGPQRALNGVPPPSIPIFGSGAEKKLKASLDAAEKLIAAGAVQTVILDSVTVFQSYLIDDLSLRYEGFEKWGKVEDVLLGAIKRLCSLPAHVFVVAHILPSVKDEEDAAGILPSIQGKRVKAMLPALIDDWVLFDCDHTRKPARQFVLGPQKNWQHHGRNIKRSCAVDATVPALFAELGIKL